MSGERELVIDLIILIGAAAGGGVLASLLRLPVILGFLLAGLVVGNYLPGWEVEIDRVQGIADLGVALLLFTLGVQFSFARLADVRRVAVLGGLAQILLTIALGYAIGQALGLNVDASLLLGAAMSLSSTVVPLKLLDARGELDSPHGRITLGAALVQDISVAPMVIILTAATGENVEGIGLELVFAALKAAALLIAAYVLGTYVVPRLLFRIAATGSRELFLLTVLALGLGFAGGSALLGLSLAFGAFLAGLIVSESEFSYQTLAEVLPLREVFATVFFVAMGMLIEPSVLVDDPVRVAAIAGALIFGKFLLTAGPVTLLGYPARVGVLVGLALANAGEFSFVLARVGVDEGLIGESVNSAILMGALISIVVSPLLLEAGPRLLAVAERSPLFGSLLREPFAVELGDRAGGLEGHVVVCGYGRIGQELVSELVRRRFRCLVIERNPYRFEELKRIGVPRVYGDASNAAVLEECNLRRARILAITLPDPASTELILAHAQRIKPGLDIIVRGRAREDYEALMSAGATEVVQPEFEAGLEFVRHTLHRFGVDRTQIQALLARRRRDAYRGRES